MRVIAAFGMTLLCASLVGCSFFEDNPYAEFIVGKVNEDTAQTDAVILVGHPQVIARETLLNDRIRKVKHLDDLILKSENKTFEPQIKRDLAVVESFVFRLGVAFNPAVGNAFQRSEELEKLRNEIEVLKFENRKNELERLSKANPSDDALNPSNETPQGTTVTDADVKAIKDQLDAIITKANALLDELVKEGAVGKQARDAGLKSTPEEHFQDLNAYRALLRHRQTALRLDDVHDKNGYTLYRLQLDATILPGQIKNRYGVLDFEVEPVKATDRQIRKLYEGLLLSLMDKGGVFLPDARRQVPPGVLTEWERTQSELIANEILERLTFSLDDRRELILFVYKGDGPVTRTLFFGTDGESLIDLMKRPSEYIQKRSEAVGERNAALEQARQEHGAASRPPENATKEILDEYGKRYKAAEERIANLEKLNMAQPAITAEYLFKQSTLDPTTCDLLPGPKVQDADIKKAVRAAGQIKAAFRSISVAEVFIASFRRNADKKTKALLNKIEGRWNDAAMLSNEILAQAETSDSSGAAKECYEIPGDDVPDTFINAVTREIKKSKIDEERKKCAEAVDKNTSKADQQKQIEACEVEKVKVWGGEAFTYQAQPTKRVQRLSTLASAVNSMQSAFSLAATIPNSGLGINAGASASKNAVGMASAVERSPLVIGYVDRQPAAATSAEKATRFGYLFGPTAILNPQTNQLEYQHLPDSHAVFADISVPGWWPELELSVRTAWAKNWHQGSTILQNGKTTRTIRRDLRPRRSAFDDLLSFLTMDDLSNSLTAAFIDDVTPDRVSSCSGVVTFLVSGVNLWRDPMAYLRGMKHSDLRVLPSMEGIAVSFDLSSLPPRPDQTYVDKLTVWTGVGKAEPKATETTNISIIDTRDGRPCPSYGGTNSAALVDTDNSRIVGGQAANVKVNLKTAMPAAARSVQVATQLIPVGETAQAPQISNQTQVTPGRFYEAQMTLNAPARLGAAALNGASVRIGLEYTLSDGGSKQYVWADKAAVFYKDANASKLEIATSTISGLG